MKWYHLVICALIAAAVCFCIMRWIFHSDINNSIGTSIAACIGGVTAQLARTYSLKKKMNRSSKS